MALSTRQSEVLAALATGDKRPVIADRLNISTRTVRFHLESARLRLGAGSTMAAVRLFILSQQRPKWRR